VDTRLAVGGARPWQRALVSDAIADALNAPDDPVDET
ncbi:MAG TPA: hypothetical protein PLC22_21150, partial [Gordonia sp. (in: high G+C Gram-positive bacteria)]|nr:hypothetical protein [Gordonia sp. (in: high G+C Gram-positive bacteria)]